MSYIPSKRPIGSIDMLEKKSESLSTIYKEHLAAIEVEYSEKARQEYMADPQTIWFQDGNKTRNECLTNQWTAKLAKEMESSARKKKRMEDARIICLVERGFHAQHCFIRTPQGKLFGYYKVTRYPTHYSFVLKRAIDDHDRVNIGKETIFPITLDMSGDDWCNVTPEKIHTP